MGILMARCPRKTSFWPPGIAEVRISLDAKASSDAAWPLTWGYSLMGYAGRLCGRITSLNYRVNLSEVLGWITGYLD